MAAKKTKYLAGLPSPKFNWAAFTKYTPAVQTCRSPGYGGAPFAVVRSAMALAEYGPFAKSSALPFDPKLNANHTVGASAVSSRALNAALRMVVLSASGIA